MSECSLSLSLSLSLSQMGFYCNEPNEYNYVKKRQTLISSTDISNYSYSYYLFVCLID